MKVADSAAAVLVTVSGVIPEDLQAQIDAGNRPRVDYLELARAFGADLLDYGRARSRCGLVGRVLERLGGPNLLLAWACFQHRHRYRLLFTDGEQVGLPLAAMLKLVAWREHTRPVHHMIAHILSVPKKAFLLDVLGLQTHIDRFFVYATWQQRFIQSRWRVPSERVVWTPFMVDSEFFSPESASTAAAAVDLSAAPSSDDSTDSATARPQVYSDLDPIICAVGLEFRDYPTLLEAARNLNARVVIAAASPWSKRPDTTHGHPLPPNVVVRRFSQFELRWLYAHSRCLVMPLSDVPFQAGVTAILEAMAMERAVICSRTAGQTDVVVEGVTGIYVPPGDAQALRAAIDHLLDDPAEAERMGKAGRRRVEQEMSLDHYVARLRRYVLMDLEQ